MFHSDELSVLDKPEILEIIFPIAYSRFDLESPRIESLTAATHFIEVEEGIKIGCKYFAAHKSYPSILYFHGNGETAFDQDWIASLYNKIGINLFMTDYRGYGVSDGKPTFTNLLLDSHKIYKSFKEIVEQEGYNPDVFVMGRSLGSIPAVEIAFRYQNEVKGLIIDSGSSRNFPFLLSYLTPDELQELRGVPFQNKDKISSIRIPTLIIHGELDEIIPAQEGKELFQCSGAADKSILIIPGSGHNDLMFNGESQYFSILGDFVNKYS
jgi:alpha-beta hydrolase superfamily lysophospholipase